MSTFGCHSCGVNLKDWENKPYETWPCATCALSKNYYHTFSTGYFDTAKMEEMEDERATIKDDDEEDDAEFITLDGMRFSRYETETLRRFQKAVSNQIMAMFSGAIVKLLKMGKDNPLALEVFLKKMQFPYMSYSEIGDSMTPKCSKQNVLYYLKAVVKEFPDLENMIMTDTRYSNGHYALRTIADKRRQQIAEERAQKILYKDRYASLRFSIEELNSILHLPFNMAGEVFDFNAYVKDDDKIHGQEPNDAD